MCILVYFISVYIVCSVCPSAIWRINVFITLNWENSQTIQRNRYLDERFNRLSLQRVNIKTSTRHLDVHRRTSAKMTRSSAIAEKPRHALHKLLLCTAIQTRIHLTHFQITRSNARPLCDNWASCLLRLYVELLIICFMLRVTRLFDLHY